MLGTIRALHDLRTGRCRDRPQRPVVVQVALDDPAASGHAISIYGYGNDRTVLLADPMHPDDKITVSFDDFVANRPTAFSWHLAGGVPHPAKATPMNKTPVLASSRQIAPCSSASLLC